MENNFSKKKFQKKMFNKKTCPPPIPPNDPTDDPTKLTKNKNNSSSHLVQQTSLDMSTTGADDYVPQQEMQMIPSTLTTESGRKPQGVHVLTSLQKNTTLSQSQQQAVASQQYNYGASNYNNNNNNDDCLRSRNEDSKV